MSEAKPSHAESGLLAAVRQAARQEQFLEVVSAEEAKKRFDAHLAICDGCVTHVEQMRQAIGTVRALRVEDVEATAPDDLLEAFRAWKRGEPIPGS